MAGYSTPAWTNGTTPAINASNLLAMGRGIELAEHPYGVCSTAAGTVAKTVTIDYSTTLSLFTGLTVRVKFSSANTASNPTLNVNSTGAKAMMEFGSLRLKEWEAGAVITFTYDGTNWVKNNAASHSGQLVTLVNGATYTNSTEGSSYNLDVAIPESIDNFVIVESIVTITESYFMNAISVQDSGGTWKTLLQTGSTLNQWARTIIYKNDSGGFALDTRLIGSNISVANVTGANKLTGSTIRIPCPPKVDGTNNTTTVWIYGIHK